uniref:Reverse transcriptase domain-containing protein n=1 Tax=Trichogramma kaykai TaxID=54128 RepID=A0ABD2XST0_9HYME
MSDHRPHRGSAGPRRRWSARTLDEEVFSERLSDARIPHATPERQEDMAGALITAISEACGASMSSGGGRRRRREPVYWWTDEIAALGENCSTRTRWCTKQGSQARRGPAPGRLLAGVLGVPERWRLPKPVEEARLVLLLKPGKPPDAPSSYHPLCMLDTAGKSLERIICRRLEVYTEAPVGLSDRQHGFWRGRSTIDAIESVTAAAREAVGGTRSSCKYCAVVTLDVRNAFNSARRNNILAENAEHSDLRREEKSSIASFKKLPGQKISSSSC